MTWDAPADATCGGGISDGSGHVAVSARTDAGGDWQVFGPDGTPQNTIDAWTLVPRPEGWHGLSVQPRENLGALVTHERLSPEGAPLGDAAANSDPDAMISERWVLAPAPHGGCFTLVGEVDASHNHWTRLEAQRFDEAGEPLWPKNLVFGGNNDHTFMFVGAGVSMRGEALALWPDSSWVNVAWLDPQGGTVAEATHAEHYWDIFGQKAPAAHQLELTPLLDGGLAVRVDGVFQRVYPHLATTSAPLPDWLASRSTWSYRFTRGNRGYAFFPPAGQQAPQCDQSIELVAPSGRLCGRVTLVGEGTACQTGIADQGWDGTVIEQRAQADCAWRFWPGLLAQ